MSDEVWKGRPCSRLSRMSFQAARRIVCDDLGVSPSIHIESSRLLIISQARDDRFDDPASASPRHLIVPFKYEFPSPAVIPPSHLKDASTRISRIWGWTSFSSQRKKNIKNVI